VEQEELNAYVVEQAYRLGVPPDRLAKEIVDRGQIHVAAGEVLRGKALRLLAERVNVRDSGGQPVDIQALTAGEDELEGDGEDAGTEDAGTGEAGEAGAGREG
jgi:trigger factor